jgi:type II secretory pathway component PulM
VLDKLAVSGLNQARHLFETIASTPTARLPLPSEFAQLSAVTRKMYDISKSAAAATPPVPTPTPEKKDVSVSLRLILQNIISYNFARILASW